MSNRPVTAKAKIKCTDSLGNVAYIHNDLGSFRCVLANGTQASMFYAVGNCDEVGFVQRLSDALDEPERLLRIVQNEARGRAVELVSYKAAPKPVMSAKELMKTLVLTAAKGIVYAAADGTTYTGREMAAEIEAETQLAAEFTKELMASGLQAMQDRVELGVEQAPSQGMGR